MEGRTFGNGCVQAGTVVRFLLSLLRDGDRRVVRERSLQRVSLGSSLLGAQTCWEAANGNVSCSAMRLLANLLPRSRKAW